MSAVALLARREAELRGHSVANWDHLLFAMLWEGGGLGARVMREIDLVETVSEAVETSLATGSSPPSLDDVLAIAATEARDLGHGYIGTEHALLALAAGGAPSQAGLDRGSLLRKLRTSLGGAT